MNILGIETSCDETAAAVVRSGHDVRSNVISSQVKIHQPYGGVVPELASRNHLQTIDGVIRDALVVAQVSWQEIDAMAATFGPGLASSLLIGLNVAKGLAVSTGRPFIGINHLEAHLYSPVLTAQRLDCFPMVSLIVSGGHTILVYATAIGTYKILGQTIDDAAGEAFDKVARLLGLGYPGGPEIERIAKRGNPQAIQFPRGMSDEVGYDFSFSGLKTAALYYLQKNPMYRREDVSASFQEAVVDSLVGKTIGAALDTGVRTVAISGGVSMNGRLRERFENECQRLGIEFLAADPTLCTDNAVMIASLAYYQRQQGNRDGFSVDVSPSCGLTGRVSV